MAINVVGVFDTLYDAQLALQGLHAGGFRGTLTTALSTESSRNWLDALVEAGMSEEHSRVCAEVVRRGGALLTIITDSYEESTRAAETLANYNVVDLDQRAAEYRQAGWTYGTSSYGIMDSTGSATDQPSNYGTTGTSYGNVTGTDRISDRDRGGMGSMGGAAGIGGLNYSGLDGDIGGGGPKRSGGLDGDMGGLDGNIGGGGAKISG